MAGPSAEKGLEEGFEVTRVTLPPSSSQPLLATLSKNKSTNLFHTAGNLENPQNSPFLTKGKDCVKERKFMITTIAQSSTINRCEFNTHRFICQLCLLQTLLVLN